MNLSGEETKILGFYDHYPSLAPEPDVILNIFVREGFEVGGQLTANHPAFDTVQIDPELFEFSRVNAKGTVQLAEGAPLRADFECALRPNTVEAIIRVVCSLGLPRKGALILHSSAVASTSGAQIFAGVSGAGKSTISAMLETLSGVQKVSDELLLVYKRASTWTVGVSPFLGSGGLKFQAEYPIVAINFLEQWPSHSRAAVSTNRAMGELCKHVLTYTQGAANQKVLDVVADLVSQVSCFQLKFAKAPSVAEVLGITC